MKYTVILKNNICDIRHEFSRICEDLNNKGITHDCLWVRFNNEERHHWLTKTDIIYKMVDEVNASKSSLIVDVLIEQTLKDYSSIEEINKQILEDRIKFITEHGAEFRVSLKEAIEDGHIHNGNLYDNYGRIV